MPSDVDPLLESLMRGMLRFEPAERFSAADVMAHDWFRKRHPCNAPPVTVKPRGDDHALSTSVIPYLCDLHFGDMGWIGGILLSSGFSMRASKICLTVKNHFSKM